MVFVDLVITNAENNTITVKDCPDTLTYSVNDVFVDCIFTGDVALNNITLNKCTFINSRSKFNNCEIVQSTVKSKYVLLHGSYITESTINADKCFVNGCKTLYSEFTCNLSSYNSQYYDTNFYGTNRKRFSLHTGHFSNCSYNYSPLVYFEADEVCVYTDGITIWAGCWILNIEVVKRHINNQDKLLEIEQKSKIQNFRYYLLAVKYILGILELS